MTTPPIKSTAHDIEKQNKVAKVASVVDQFRVVINLGSLDGVKTSQRYVIYNIGEEIFDPDTHESLGRLELVKGRGAVIHVQDRMATLQTIDSKKVENSYLLSLSKVREEPQAFIDAKIGDFARLIT